VETIPISKFKARCLAVLARVNRTGKPVLITRFGQPVAEVVPPTSSLRPERWLGSFRGSGRIVGDIVAPVVEEHDWEALRS
jgi:prevent-host-death family protein